MIDFVAAAVYILSDRQRKRLLVCHQLRMILKLGYIYQVPQYHTWSRPSSLQYKSRLYMLLCRQ